MTCDKSVKQTVAESSVKQKYKPLPKVGQNRVFKNYGISMKRKDDFFEIFLTKM